MAQREEMDRVCVMWIETKTAKFTSNYQGEAFYLCARIVTRNRPKKLPAQGFSGLAFLRGRFENRPGAPAISAPHPERAFILSFPSNF